MSFDQMKQRPRYECSANIEELAGVVITKFYTSVVITTPEAYFSGVVISTPV